MATYTTSYLPATWNIIAYQGQDVEQDITVTIGDPPFPFDFTGMDAVMDIRVKVGSAILFTYTSADGDIDLVGDTITFRLYGADTQTMTCGLYYVYDMRFTTGGSSPVYLLSGTIKIISNITPTV